LFSVRNFVVLPGIVLRLMNNKQKPAKLLEDMYAPLYTTKSMGVPSIEAEEAAASLLSAK